MRSTDRVHVRSSTSKGTDVEALPPRTRAERLGGLRATPQEGRAPMVDGGEPLPAGVRAPMERAVAADLSTVRLHVGSEAARRGARALAYGEHVHVDPSEYDPSSARGRFVLGHELAHVLQQREADRGLEAEPTGRASWPRAGAPR